MTASAIERWAQKIKDKYVERGPEVKERNHAEFVFRVVTNIPEKFEAAELRNYFHDLVEKEAFIFFHYIHKNDSILMGQCLKLQAFVTQNMWNEGFQLTDPFPEPHRSVKQTEHCFCFIKIKKVYDKEFKETYGGKFWVDCYGKVHPRRCRIMDFNVEKLLLNYVPKNEKDKLTTPEQIRELSLLISQYYTNHSNVFELSQRAHMICGNIGTSNEEFKKVVEKFELHPSIMYTYGIAFPCNPQILRMFCIPLLVDEDSNIGKTLTAIRDVVVGPDDLIEIINAFELNKLEGVAEVLQQNILDTAVLEYTGDWHNYEMYYDELNAIEDEWVANLHKLMLPLSLSYGKMHSISYSNYRFDHVSGDPVNMRLTPGWDRLNAPNFDVPSLKKEEQAALRAKYVPKNRLDAEKIKKRPRRCIKYPVGHPFGPWSCMIHMARGLKEGNRGYYGLNELGYPFKDSLLKPKRVDNDIWDKYFEGSFIALYGNLYVRARGEVIWFIILSCVIAAIIIWSNSLGSLLG